MITLLNSLIGLAIGSFANVCIHRLPHGESLWTPKSHCPRCNRSLPWFDNIPLVSFVLLHGHCRFCRDAIPWRYPVVEFAMASLFLIGAGLARGSFERVIYIDLTSFYLLTLSIIDFEHKIIPDELSLTLWAVGLLLALYASVAHHHFRPLLESVFAGIVGASSMMVLAWLGEKVFKKEALGGGDVKLLGALGALLGWNGVAGSILLGSLSGGMVGGLLMLLGLKKRRDAIPFGPFLSLGGYVSCLWPGWWLVAFRLSF